MTPQDKSSAAAQSSADERRKEPRYPIDARVIVRRKSGEQVRLRAMDISGSGMRLCFEGQPPALALDEEVTIEIELAADPDEPLWNWGFGRVAYMREGCAGIQVYGGQFDRPA
jgi:PilZ domain